MMWQLKGVGAAGITVADLPREAEAVLLDGDCTPAAAVAVSLAIRHLKVRMRVRVNSRITSRVSDSAGVISGATNCVAWLCVAGQMQCDAGDRKNYAVICQRMLQLDNASVTQMQGAVRCGAGHAHRS